MIKTLLFTLAALAAYPLSGAAQQADMVKFQAHRGALQTAAHSQTTAFRQTQQLEQIYRAAAWKDTLRTNYSRFTAASLPAQMLREQSSNGGSSWNPTRRNHRRFTAAGAILNDTTFTFSTAGVATARFATASTFTATNKLAQSTARWLMGSSWTNYSRDTYTYDSQDRLSQLLLEGYIGSSFYNSARFLYTYNAQNLVSVEEVQQYSDATSSWRPLEKYLSTYNVAGKIIEFITQQAPGTSTTYQNYRRETYTYDAQVPARITRTVVDSWNGSAWAIVGQNLFVYDTNGNLTSITTQLYRPATSTYDNYYRVQYSYQTVTATTAARTLDASLQVLPNPAAPGEARIQYRLPRPGAATIDVLDLAGRTVGRLQLPTSVAAEPHTVELTGLQLPAGLYMVRLTAGNQSQQQKLVIR